MHRNIYPIDNLNEGIVVNLTLKVVVTYTCSIENKVIITQMENAQYSFKRGYGDWDITSINATSIICLYISYNSCEYGLIRKCFRYNEQY